MVTCTRLGRRARRNLDQIQSAWRTTAKRLHPTSEVLSLRSSKPRSRTKCSAIPLERGRYDRMRRRSATNHATTSSHSRAYAYLHRRQRGLAQRFATLLRSDEPRPVRRRCVERRKEPTQPMARRARGHRRNRRPRCRCCPVARDVPRAVRRRYPARRRGLGGRSKPDRHAP